MGERIGPYEVVRRLAEGGMAEVFLSRYHGGEGLERLAVLKRLRRDESAHDEERVEMFVDEARIMASLCHPNIAQVFDVLRDGGGDWYIAMEHVDGPSLRDLLDAARARGGIVPRVEALGIALWACEALAYAHTQKDELGRKLGLVHRDLTPANVVVAYHGAVKLVDFGIAKAATKVHETRTGLVRGTPGYMSPEQLRGEKVDFRTDVFAMGVLLYELCLGVQPFRDVDVPRGILPPHRPVAELDPALAADLAQLVEACLARRPADRPANIGVVRDTLAGHLVRAGTWPTMARIALVVHDLCPSERDHATVVAPPSVALPRRRTATVASPARRAGVAALLLAVIAALAFVLGRALGG